jgi:S1-C subfamily serine protease
VDRRPRERLTARAVLVLALCLLPCAAAGAGDDVEAVEREFKKAIENVTPATVVCIAKGADASQWGSSGVIVSKKGLVLTDGDAGLVQKRVKDRLENSHHTTDVEVRVPDAKSGYKSYQAKCLRRDEKADSMLLRIENPPPAGFPKFPPMGTSDGLEVGDLVFAVGNAFNLSAEGMPSVTSGVVSALLPLPAGDARGRYDFLYSSAAVNFGVNGGPLVDIEGRLVGTVSTVMPPDSPFQFLGKVVPIDMLRAVYGDLPEAAELFPPAKPTKARSTQAAALELAYHAAAMKAYPWVASLVVTRGTPLSVETPNPQLPLGRYVGPSSAVVVDGSGLVVTSLYNLTNTVTLTYPPWTWPSPPPPPTATVEKGLADVTAITVCLPDGRNLPAKILGHDPRLGVALLQAELPPSTPGAPSYALPVPTTAPSDTAQEGRFVLALGNPFGETRCPSPLLTVGILSKRHGPDSNGPWRNQWQTDAGGTDGNCGGALVDLEGRVLGILQIWAPLSHGRNSGIAFVTPWEDVKRALPDMQAGKVPRRGMMGIKFKPDSFAADVESVEAGSGAARAGILPGDEIVKINGKSVGFRRLLQDALAYRWEGETIHVSVARSGKVLELDVVLGPRTD